MAGTSTRRKKTGGSVARPTSRVKLVYARVSAAQRDAFLKACELVGLKPAKAGAVAVVRWTQMTLAQAADDD